MSVRALKRTLFSLALLLGLSLSPLTFAEDGDVAPDSFNVFEVLTVDEDATDETGATTISDNLLDDAEKYDGNIVVAVMMRVINILLLLIGTFAFLVIFYSGVLLVTSNGDEGKIEKGKGMIMPAILGLVFAFLSYYIATFVQSFFY